MSLWKILMINVSETVILFIIFFISSLFIFLSFLIPPSSLWIPFSFPSLLSFFLLYHTKTNIDFQFLEKVETIISTSRRLLGGVFFPFFLYFLYYCPQTYLVLFFSHINVVFVVLLHCVPSFVYYSYFPSSSVYFNRNNYQKKEGHLLMQQKKEKLGSNFFPILYTSLRIIRGLICPFSVCFFLFFSNVWSLSHVTKQGIIMWRVDWIVQIDGREIFSPFSLFVFFFPTFFLYERCEKDFTIFATFLVKRRENIWWSFSLFYELFLSLVEWMKHILFAIYGKFVSKMKLFGKESLFFWEKRTIGTNAFSLKKRKEWNRERGAERRRRDEKR